MFNFASDFVVCFQIFVYLHAVVMPIGANMFHLKPESDCAPECNIIEEL
jgi:hypothetical protein